MTFEAVMTMVVTMTIVTLFAGYFFRKILTTPQKSDTEEEAG